MNTGDNEWISIGVNNYDNARIEESVTEVIVQHGRQLADTDERRAEEKDDTLQDKSKQMIITVKTKTEDGGGGSQPTEKNGPDAFSKYSNTNVRMMYLLGLDDAAGGNEDNADWQHYTGYQGRWRLREGGVNQDGNARKTRLSTELHVSVFYGQLFGVNRPGRQE
mmetsp:Transcript_21059/g.38599  ORF Transcript_21059/g.38599 Transcript_21059/m.38599 type:complete len:165 (+) Transcript_21059:252-746(+)|eukprot:CAMPEP_0201900584 /NCGR_PEP_ID=MMETSP0902-20130614/52632_1 /ASSEMBLY_ACC=CAM_ASM_000551 /TAXON_ID=420261 /ORGANISM="Thalassiosira antarctica, Strain CCMP982" /LENGTH=164 /DNA_ID=CAMNT_0048434303 /DNA_START=401 /DNA_END=895 /DNA_ORIENTATION=-